MRDAVIVSAVRTAVGKAPRGSLRETPPEALAMTVVREALARIPQLDPAEVEDLVLGCAMPEGAQGLNIARQVAIGAGIPDGTSAMTINRFCASGLQALALASAAIQTGVYDVVVAGGMESMSFVPMIGHRFTPDPPLADTRPQVYLSMGITAERVSERFGVSREDQDAWGVRSHLRASAAQREGRFRDEIASVEAALTEVDSDGRPTVRRMAFEADEGIRHDADPARMASLKPVFATGGTVTAGNSSQMSDGAAAMVVMTAERAAQLGLEPLGRLVSFATAGVDPEIMGIGPVKAVPKALAKAGLSLEDMAVIELNEAFAAQVVAVVRQLGFNEERTNVNGGAIALGHPLGATGAKLTVQILSELARRDARYGLVTMCVGGGQGAAGVIEWLGGRQPAAAPADGGAA
ncbi:MAG TPA: thiolase family protein [Candidatus Limnocylindrales bacterium]